MLHSRLPLHQISLRGTRKGKPLVFPTGDATDHDLDRTTKAGEANGRAVGTIAMWTGTINDEQRVHRPLSHPFRSHIPMRNVNCSRDVTLCKHRRRANNVKQHKVNIAGLTGCVNICTIRFQRQSCGKMSKGDFQRSGWVVGDITHWGSPGWL